jgi:sugar lactone lactonase YvrE
MKRNFIFFVIIIIAGTGCKKNSAENISTGKKWIVTTVAGGSTHGGFLDGPASLAKFNAPNDVAVAPDGTIYVADYKNHRIRKIMAGQVSTLAGNSSGGIINGNSTLAEFEDPYRITLDPSGNLYIVDEGDIRIRKINSGGDVSFFAGTSTAGFLDGSASTAQFQLNEGGIVSDAQGNIYIGDMFNNRIRKIGTDNQVITVAGSTGGFTDGDAGTAQFNFPDGVTLDREGNIYVADEGNFCIRKITATGTVSILAGSGVMGTADGNGRLAQFGFIGDMVADSDGNIFVIDDNRIRKITPQGVVSTIAGSGPGYVDGDGTSAKFNGLSGIGIDAQGNLYVADVINNRIRKISYQ